MCGLSCIYFNLHFNDVDLENGQLWFIFCPWPCIEQLPNQSCTSYTYIYRNHNFDVSTASTRGTVPLRNPEVGFFCVYWWRAAEPPVPSNVIPPRSTTSPQQCEALATRSCSHGGHQGLGRRCLLLVFNPCSRRCPWHGWDTRSGSCTSSLLRNERQVSTAARIQQPGVHALLRQPGQRGKSRATVEVVTWLRSGPQKRLGTLGEAAGHAAKRPGHHFASGGQVAIQLESPL